MTSIKEPSFFWNSTTTSDTTTDITNTWWDGTFVMPQYDYQSTVPVAVRWHTEDGTWFDDIIMIDPSPSGPELPTLPPKPLNKHQKQKLIEAQKNRKKRTTTRLV